MNLATLTSPSQWALALAVGAVVLMPRLIPPIARILGRVMAVAMRSQTTGASGRSKRRSVSRLASGPASIEPQRPPQGVRLRDGYVWRVGLLVALVSAVLSWWLLRPR